jgi:hypothetical protein
MSRTRDFMVMYCIMLNVSDSFEYPNSFEYYESYLWFLVMYCIMLNVSDSFEYPNSFEYYESYPWFLVMYCIMLNASDSFEYPNSFEYYESYIYGITMSPQLLWILFLLKFRQLCEFSFTIPYIIPTVIETWSYKFKGTLH